MLEINLQKRINDQYWINDFEQNDDSDIHWYIASTYFVYNFYNDDDDSRVGLE